MLMAKRVIRFMPSTLNRARHCHSLEAARADVSQTSWRKSSASHINGNCVEMGRLGPDQIGIRDTKDNGTGPILIFTGAAWNAFVAGAKAGEFDDL